MIKPASKKEIRHPIQKYHPLIWHNLPLVKNLSSIFRCNTLFTSQQYHLKANILFFPNIVENYFNKQEIVIPEFIRAIIYC